MNAPKRGRPTCTRCGGDYVAGESCPAGGDAPHSRRGMPSVLREPARKGRPRSESPRRVALLVRLTPAEHVDLVHYAAQRGEPLSVAIREAALRAARWRP